VLQTFATLSLSQAKQHVKKSVITGRVSCHDALRNRSVDMPGETFHRQTERYRELRLKTDSAGMLLSVIFCSLLHASTRFLACNALVMKLVVVFIYGTSKDVGYAVAQLVEALC
jgi:hypothetical protein